MTKTRQKAKVESQKDEEGKGKDEVISRSRSFQSQ